MEFRTKLTEYTQMTLKELEKEHLKENQILLDMINDGSYSQKQIQIQKSLVDYIYKKIYIKKVEFLRSSFYLILFIFNYYFIV